MKRLIAAGCLLVGFAAAPLHAHEDVSLSEQMKHCREEVWRVQAHSNGPKSPWSRFEKRTVLVCDESILARIRGRKGEAGCPATSEKG